jgi:hypothetical protein
MWEFNASPINGKCGPTPALKAKLEKLGFDVKINE